MTCLSVDEGGQGEVVEKVGEETPDVSVPVFAETFVVEAVNLGDLPGLVVASEDGDSVLVSEFESNEKCDGLNGIVASVDVITHKKVVGVWRVSPDSE